MLNAWRYDPVARSHAIAWLVFFGFLFSAIALDAQSTRIPGSIEGSQTVALPSAVPLQAVSAADQGAVAPYLAMNDLALLLKPSPEEQQLLDQLMAAQRNPSSPSYRRWLTPEQYADRFGLSPSDLGKIATWLQSQGFQVGYQARGRNWIAFRGTAQQVEQTFHTQIHTFLADGVTHYANTSAPSIPAALAGIVTNVAGLHNFHPKPPPHNKMPAVQGTTRPDYTTNGSYYLAPDDFATIYDLLPLYSAGIDGTGQKLAMMGQTDIYPGDIANFRAVFGLSNNPPQMVLYGPDPGYSDGDIEESELDLEWSGAVARNATVLFVYSDDVFTSVRYAVSENLAPVISLSYGECEQYGLSILDFYRSVAQQAAVQGITWVNSSGDSGAAGCDYGGPYEATQGKAVDFPASIPEVTAVGGTEFNEGNGTYWSSSNGSTQASALSYIPEKAWNDTSAGGGIWSGGGGVSIYYPTPVWQTGPGFPNDGHRDVPDVSLNASADHDGYIVCWPGANCSGPSLQSFDVNGGTSASAPSFAGILALLNQYLAASGSPGLGNANPQLYTLFQFAPSAFHDVTVGDNIVPCETGTPNCTTGSFGYSAQAGYDQATGLGSVDAYNLITAWAPSILAITKTHVGDFTQGQTGATYTVTVTNASASTPTSGTVTVTDAIPTGLTLVSMSGLGWTCNANACTRSDVLNSGASYPAITVTVNVDAVAPPLLVTNRVSVFSGGLSTASDVTNIIPTVPPSAVVLTSPPNGATGVTVAPQLTWNAAAETVSYDVYFGTSTSPSWVANTAQTSYSPAPLAGGTTYYWQVVAKNGIGTASSPIWSFTTQNPYLITTVAGGTFGSGGDGGLAVFAQMESPGGVATDSSGNFYMADFETNTVRKITPNGIISTAAGTGVPGYSGDGGAATSAQLYDPLGLFIDAFGNMYIGDAENCRIRKVDSSGTITTVAGNGMCGYAGDGGPATSAELSFLYEVTADSSGNLYIADAYNSRIRKVDTHGIITTVAGNGTYGYSGDGGAATSAQLDFPTGVALDSAGNLYIDDNENNRIRKVDTTGIITTVAGNGTPGYSGDSGPATSAELNYPYQIAVDGAGDLFIADSSNYRVRLVTPDGNISTVAGTGFPGYSGDGGVATNAMFEYPGWMTLDSHGNIYVDDINGYAIRLLTPAGTQPVVTVTGTHAGNFLYGQSGMYTLTVANAVLAGTTSGTVSVTDIVPSGLTLVSMSGTGWNCAASTCTRSDALAGGGSYPPITVAVNVSSNPPTEVVNEASVSGGGAPVTGSRDPTTILQPPTLSISKSHTGNFVQGQSGTYTVVVSNFANSIPTSGAVTVTDTIPTGLTLTSMAGTGWTCPANTCTRSDALNGGSSYPPITVTVSVASNAPSSVTNQVGVSGGGSAPASASDVTTIVALPAPPVLISPANGAAGVVVTPTLTWNVSAAATSYDVYFGTSPAPPYVTTTTNTSFNPAGTLAANTTYYWQVVANNIAGSGISAIWSFTTQTPYLIETIAGGVNGSAGDGGLAAVAQLSYPSGVAKDSAGNLYIADGENNRVRMVAPNGVISTVAGTGTAGFSGDGGAATSAELNWPSGVALDGSGNLYIADEDNGRVRKVDTNGVITTVAGNGIHGYSGDGGPATSAELYYPDGLALDGSGNLYIADGDNDRVRKVDTNGIITTVAGNGTPGYSGDSGPATSAELNSPYGAAVDASGNLYIADAGNSRIRKVDANGIITTVAGNGYYGYSGDGGPATSAELSSPYGAAVDASGNVYVADTGNNRIRVVGTNGTINTIAGSGNYGLSGDGGLATSAGFGYPGGVALDSTGNIYVADTDDDAIRLLTPAGAQPVLTIKGTHTGSFTYGQNGTYTLTVSNAVLAVATSGAVSVSEILPTALTLVSMSGTGWTCAGNSCSRTDALAGGSSYPAITVTVSVSSNPPSSVVNEAVVSGGGGAITGSLDTTNIVLPPTLSISKSHSGSFLQGQTGATYTVYVSNSSSSVPTSGTVTVTDTIPTGLTLVSMAGSGWTCAANACTRSDALSGGFEYPEITVTVNVASNAPASVTNQVSVSGGGSATGNASDVTTIVGPPAAPVLIAPANDATRVSLTPTLSWNASATADSYGVYFGTSTAPAFAGNTTSTSFTPTGPLASQATYYWQVVAQNAAGSASSAVWSFATQAPYLITTIAGGNGQGYAGDGGLAVFAQFISLTGVAKDAAGNVYIADVEGNIVRKVTPSGIISTFAGTGTLGFSGDGGAATNAEFQYPWGVALDAAGNLYISDERNYRIRKVDTSGVITTVVGNGTSGHLGDGGAATAAELGCPMGIAFDASGNLYIADLGNNDIRMVNPSGIITTVAGNGTAGYSGDGGPATSAELYNPYGIAADASGNLYIADSGTDRIRKVDTKGIITTVAGGGNPPDGLGDGGSATEALLYGPTAVSVDASGNLYIADTWNCRIREVDTAGVIHTLAGNGNCSLSGDGGPAASAGVSYPEALAIDNAGNIYIADDGNFAVRLLTSVNTRAVLTIKGTHVGNFMTGQNGTYTLTVTNAPLAGTTSGAVAVTDILPTGLTLTSMSGTGWTCSANTCTRSDALAGGSSYPAITVTVSVSSTPPPQVVNEAAVSGGGVAMTGSSDTTTIVMPPELAISKTHTGNFAQGQSGASYTVTVSNLTSAPSTSGTVTVADAIPTGLTLVSMAGTGWTCSANSCTRSDALSGGSSYPSITVTVNVASNAPASVTNQVSVSGGGSATANASDVTTVISSVPTVTTSAATSVTGSGALLAGSVSPNGADTHVWFLYSTNVSMSGAVSTPSQDIGSGTAAVPVTANITGLAASTPYYFQAVAQNGAGTTQGLILSFNTSSPPSPAKIGTYNAGQWYLDVSGTGAWAGDPPDVAGSFGAGLPGAIPVTGDWNGDGHKKMGVFYQGFWYLDFKGDGTWDGGVVDKQYSFGWSDPNVIPVVGDWNGDGRTKIGIYYQGFWYLDYNGNGVWDGPSVDKAYNFGWAATGVTPIVGDWSGSGTTKIGIYDQGFWYLDFIGNGVWDGGVNDKAYNFGWQATGVTPILGDWNGDGRAKIGIYYYGFWYLDYDGNGVWDGGINDKMYNLGWPDPAVTPLVGDWSGSGTTKIGIFYNGYWYLDYNGNGAWDGAPPDKGYVFGQAGDTPIVGTW